jgi:hypothetical protein
MRCNVLSLTISLPAYLTSALLWFVVAFLPATLIFLPWQLYNYLFPRHIKATPLANRSVLLVLLLCHNCRSRGWVNPYRAALCSLTDETSGAAGEVAWCGSVPHFVCASTCAARLLGPTSDPVPAGVVVVA